MNFLKKLGEYVKSLVLFNSSENWFYLTIFSLPFLAVSPWQTFIKEPIYLGLVYATLVILTSIAFLKEILKKKIKEVKFDLLPVLLAFIVINIISLALSWQNIRLDPVITNATGLRAPYIFNIFLIGYLCFQVFTFWLIQNIVNSKKILANTIRIIFISASIAAFYGGILVLLNMFGFIKELAGPAWIVPRLTGTATEAQVFGSFLLSAIPLSFALYITSKDIFKFYHTTAMIFILCLSMVMTFSFGGWLCLFIALLVTFTMCLQYIKYERIIAFAIILVLIFCTCAVIGFTISPNYLSSFKTIMLKIEAKTEPQVQTITPEATSPAPAIEATVYSRTDRLYLYKTAYYMWQSSPLIGVGTGNFGFLHNFFKGPDFPARTYLAKAHNIYLEVLAETGIAGIIVFLLFFALLIYRLLKYYFVESDPSGRVIIAGLMGSVVGFMSNGMVFGVLAHNYSWMVFGLSLAVVHIFSKKINR